MANPFSNNVLGHRAKFETLRDHLPKNEVGQCYVGGGDPLWIGFIELEILRSIKQLKDTSIADVGCGIGRLANHLRFENICRYFGCDIIPEILTQAIEVAGDDSRFSFSIVDDFKIPLADNSTDIVAAFSLITHLLDEEIFEYILEFKRILKQDGVAVISFLDFDLSIHANDFFKHAKQYRNGHGDLLRFTTKSILLTFAREAGFGKVEFIDGGTEFPSTKLGGRLMSETKIPDSLTFGQSLCFFYCGS